MFPPNTQGPHVKANQSAEAVKGELVDSARLKWPLYFSKFYEVTMMSGRLVLHLTHTQLVIDRND